MMTIKGPSPLIPEELGHICLEEREVGKQILTSQGEKKCVELMKTTQVFWQQKACKLPRKSAISFKTPKQSI